MTDINRRQFLSVAGAAGFATSFPAIARALSIPASVTTGTLMDVKHVVILMQENRSFDHYFGTLAGVRGFIDPYPAPTPALAPTEHTENVCSVFQQRFTMGDKSIVASPFPLNTRQSFEHMRVEGTPHSWPDAQAAWDNGRMQHWPDAKQLHSLGYFERDDIPFQYALADAFTLCDAYHCSMQTGTNPNRLFLWSGTIDASGQDGGPAIGNSHDNFPANGGAEHAYTWTTYVERLQSAGVDWTIYQDMDDNFTDNPLVGFDSFRQSFNRSPNSDPELARRGLTTRGLDQLADDVLANKLPSVSYIIATAEGSEHPGPSSPAQGAAYTAEVLDRLTANPEVWSQTALFIMFDENDGFFDHLPPPAPPSPDATRQHGYAGDSHISTEGEYHTHPSSADADLDLPEYRQRPYGLGPRVPAYVISPWSRGGKVNSEVLDHTSVIRFLEQRFGVVEPNISPWRRAVCGDFLNAFDFANPNQIKQPTLPDPRADAAKAALLPGRTTPPLPSKPTLPMQESGFRKQCPNLYAIELQWHIVEKPNPLSLKFQNIGERTVVIHLYDRLNLEAIPHRYTIAGNRQMTVHWPVTAGRYDIQIMGPEGFHRRIAGSLSTLRKNALRVKTTSAGCFLQTDASGLQLELPETSDSLQSLMPEQQRPIPVDDNGRYNLVVTQVDDPSYRQEFAGRLFV